MTYDFVNWNYPTQIKVGQGRISEVAESCKRLGIKAPLLITDPGLSALAMVHSVVDLCLYEGLNCAVYDQVQGNPSKENVELGISAYRQGSHDGVIAFGGGSVLDVGKAVALMSGQLGSLWDFEDKGDNWSRADEAGIAPVIAIPTTAGTGSEVGRASVITDKENHEKRIVFHPKMLPECVILDPEVTVGLPSHITAATGMDALSHNLEALCAPTYHPMADGIALEAIALIKNYLPIAVEEGQNIEARTQMLVASSMGATAFQKGLGAMHAIAHSLGALYNTHHGLLNAILMPYVLMKNKERIEQKIEGVARFINLSNSSFDGFIQWVLQLRVELGIPHTLKEIDIDKKSTTLIGNMSFSDPSALGNPILFSAKQYSELFENAVDGILG